MRAREEMRDAAGMAKHAWTCTRCHQGCPLTLVHEREGSRFRSTCCLVEVLPTKGYVVPSAPGDSAVAST